MKNNNTLESLIQAEQKKLEKLEEKQADIAKKIKVCKDTIHRYQMMKDSQQFSAISNALDGVGISIEDVLSAIAAGDMLSLQEKIESAGAEVPASEAEDGKID